MPNICWKFEAPDLPTARVVLHQLLQTYIGRAPNAMALLEAGFDDASAVLALPEPYRRRLRASNGIERLNEEVRRRERVIRIFPNRESAIRLLGALLMGQHEHGPPDIATWTWPPIGSGSSGSRSPIMKLHTRSKGRTLANAMDG